MKRGTGWYGGWCGLVVVLGFGWSCSVDAPMDALRFACSTDTDCADGWRCDQGECLRGAALTEVEDAGPTVEPDCVPFPEVCGNGADDDCDGLTDCSDSDCTNPKESCGNGTDDDCDGRVDCEDSECEQRGCGAIPTAVCCSGSCVDIARSPTDCGGCGIACRGGQDCIPVPGSGVEAQAISGQCSCNAPSHCPNRQYCSDGLCGCASDSSCAGGQTCSATTTSSDGPGWCISPP